MTSITFYVKPDNTITGFQSKGHAGYGIRGTDVVCASVSILIINTINSIENFTDSKCLEKINDKRATIDFEIDGSVNPQAQLLFKSLELGIKGISESYPGNVSIKYKEV